MNQSNKDEKLLAEIEEGRPLIEENTLQPNTRSTQSEGKRVTRVGECAENSKGKQRDEIHLFAPSRVG
jgi:hypothetical protein